MSDYYKISDVAKMLGISAELVRHYERLGILKPKRSINGYRRYTTRDINILTGSRRYVHMGFSIEEAEFLINEASLEEAIDSLAGMEKKAVREIRWKQLVLKEIQQLKDKYKLIHDFENNIFKFDLQMSPSVYRINCQKNMTIILKEALACDIKKWIEKLPVVKISPEFTLESVYNMTDDYSFGFAVDENLAEELDLINTPGIKFYPSRLCLTTLIKSEGANHICPRSLQDALNYMDKHNMKMADNAWGITIGNYTKNGIHQKYHLIYIPIEYMDRL